MISVSTHVRAGSLSQVGGKTLSALVTGVSGASRVTVSDFGVKVLCHFLPHVKILASAYEVAVPAYES